MALTMGGKKPYLALILIQIIYAGMILLSKAVLIGGLNSYVFMFYRQLVGTISLAPLALIFERKEATQLSFGTFCKIFMLAFLGITLALNVFYLGLDYTSATLSSAASNSVPVTTFLSALLLGMEKVNLRRTAGIAKVAGLTVCLAGVATLAFYEGPHLKPFVHYSFFNYHGKQDHQAYLSFGKRWVLGCFLLFISVLSWGLWFVLQARFLESYTSKLTFTTVQCLCSAIQSFAVAIALERDPHRWKLGWNITLFTVVYCGTLVAGGLYYLQTWVIEKKGPVFLAMATPLNMIFTITGSLFLLGEAINFGSVLGGILLVVSLYSVLWGKSKEKSEDNLGNQQDQAEKQNADLKEVEVTENEP